MLYDAQNRPIESTVETPNETEQDHSIPTENFPPPTPKPDWFDAAVTKIGGYFDPGTNKLPKYRVVWGMDPAITQFAMGEMHMKYISIIARYETTKGYNVVNVKKGRKFFLDAKTAHRRYFDHNTGMMTKNLNRNEIIQPVIVEETKEIGQPWWVVEQYVPAEAFGDTISWNNERYLINPENPLDYIDALGEYPEQGRYIHWFDLLDYDEEGKPLYHELNDGAIELIRANHIANIARRKRIAFTTPEQAKAQRDSKFDAYWDSVDDDITKEMRDIKKHKAFNITSKG